MKFLVRILGGAAIALTALPAVATTGDTARGHELFAGSCAYCHSERGFATALLNRRFGPGNGLLEARTDLTPELIRQVVRHGFGGMPWYRRVELSDADLDAIVAYLTSPKAQQ